MSAATQSHPRPAKEGRPTRRWERWVPRDLRPQPEELHREPVAEPRRLRDTVVDVFLMLVVAAIGIPAHFEGLNAADRPPQLFFVLSVVAFPVALAVIPLRRNRPEVLAAVSVPLASLAISACGLSLVAAFAVGARLRPPRAVPWIAVLVLASWLNTVIWPSAGTGSFASDIVLGTAVTVGLGALGMYLNARRQLLITLRERADRAESEQQLRVDQARQQERNRIAREMHDVLAHRMSLLSVHAGALEYRADAAPEEVSRAAGVIRSTAHEALEELRSVIGVLRAAELSDDAQGTDLADQAPEPPAPTLADVRQLVDGWRDAWARIDLDLAVDPAAVGAVAGRTAYRIVQEALTNAGKHAPAARVTVRIAPEGAGLRVHVENPLAPGGAGAAAIPGTGVGLVGLRERAQLAGGQLEAARDEEAGRFVLSAWLAGRAA